MYLLDSNIYLNFYERYYKMAYFPSFWSQLPGILNEYVVIPEVVMAENIQDPTFISWVKENYHKNFVEKEPYFHGWQEVLQYIFDSEYYKDQAITGERGWGRESIADPWIIAIAKANHLTVVTEELGNINLNSRNPSKNPKIPDVCQHFEVRCINMNGFFQEIHLSV